MRRVTFVAVAAVSILLPVGAAARTTATTNQPPTASLTSSPVTPRTGDRIDFTATATDPEHDPVTFAWDLDGDGAFDDATGSTASATFARGPHTVAVRATDSHNASKIVTQTVAVGNAAPSGSFTATPDTPRTGDAVTLSAKGSDPEGDALTYRWDVDGDGTLDKTGDQVTTRLARGDRPVALQVSDPSGASATVTRTLAVADAPPVGDFTWGPDRTPLSGDLVHFAATGVDDPDDGAAAVDVAWDLDDDGTFETTGPAAETHFRSPGPHTVALRLVDPAGQSTVIRHTVTVANRAPVAAFDAGPAAPAPGQDVTLTSRATDPDGGTMQLQQEWDLDGDGQFDDATGPVVHRSFDDGQHVVRLRVTDGDGGVAIAESTLVVAPPAQGGAATAANAASSALEPAQLGLLPMMPFPVVRLRGRATRQGVVVDLLSVTAPAGAQIRLRCMGPGCPSAGRIVSLRALRSLHHALRAGVILEVRVARSGSIGKLVRFTFGRGRPPVRLDGCVNGAGAPMECS